MKHVLKYTNGCTCTSLTVDDVETIDMDINDFRKVIKQMVRLYFHKMNEYVFNFMKDMVSDYTNESKAIQSSKDDFYEVRVYEKYVDNVLITYCEVFFEDMIFFDHKLWNKNVNDYVLYLVDKLIDETEDISIFQDFFCKVIGHYGILEDGYPHYCDCCGDYIYSYTMEI